ncbi:MAG: FHA domain-containing protein, partial [Chitinophagaceae bacterium]
MGLFDRFRKEGTDAKSIRDELLYALRTRLAAFEGAEARGLRALTLYLAPDAAQRAEYEAAVYASEPGRFRTELGRIVEDYALSLPTDWELSTEFVATLPADATALGTLPAALFISGAVRQGPAVGAAKLRVLAGQAEQGEYPLRTDGSRVTIGREQQVQMPDGFVRINTVAFLPDSGNEANRFVSRQHAHIRYDAVGLIAAVGQEGDRIYTDKPIR